MPAYDIQQWIQQDMDNLRPTANNGNPGGANNSPVAPQPQGYGYAPDSRLGAFYNGQNTNLGRYRPPMISSMGGGAGYGQGPTWQDHGGYAYNLPNHYGEFNYQRDPYMPAGGTPEFYPQQQDPRAMRQMLAMMMEQGRSRRPQRVGQPMAGGPVRPQGNWQQASPGDVERWAAYMQSAGAPVPKGASAPTTSRRGPGKGPQVLPVRK